MSFLPWGAGPRNCIGISFAYMMVKIAIARILLGAEIQTTDETPVSKFNNQSFQAEINVLALKKHEKVESKNPKCFRHVFQRNHNTL